MANPEPVMPDGIAEFPSDIDDVDFGPLELFDSNVMAGHFSQVGASQVPATPFAAAVGDAPEAAMSEESMHAPSMKKPKRERRSSAALDPTLSAVDAGAKMKHKRSHMDPVSEVEVPYSQVRQDQAAASRDAPSQSVFDGGAIDQVPMAWPKSSAKRKPSESAEGRRRKKRRSHSHRDEPELGDLEGAGLLASAAAFLRGNSQAGVPSGGILTENDAEADADASGRQPSPPTDVANLGHPSQPGEAPSRENSVPRAATDLVTLGLEAAHGVDMAARDHADVYSDVQALAREAWTEHRNSKGSLTDTQGANANPPDPAAAQTPEATPRRPRSTKKKAKKTFFEQHPTGAAAEGGGDTGDTLANAPADAPLPAAAASTSQGRAKMTAKRTTTKGKKPQRPSPRPAHGASDDDDDDDDGPAGEDTHASRRNRLVGYTQGRFSDAELSRIATAVESFRGENDLTQQQVNEMIHAPGGTTAGDAHAQLWMRVFDKCPDRHRQKVINITRKKFHNFIARGTWTPEQDTELTALINVHGRKWSKIAAIINRHPEDLRDRYRNYLVCGDNQRKDTWDETEEARLTQHVINSIKAVDEIRKEGGKPNPHVVSMSYEELIDWQNISELMGRTRSRLQCITKWKSLNIRTHGMDKLVSSEPDARISFRLEKARRQIAAMPGVERYRLVLAIKKTSVGKDAKIPWQRLVDKQFRNQWHRLTQMLLWRRLRQSIPGGDAMATRDCALYLTEHYNQAGELPEVDGTGYDDADEMAFILSIPPPTVGVCSAAAASGYGGGKSAEFVDDSDPDGPDAAMGGDADEEGGDVDEEADDDDDDDDNFDDNNDNCGDKQHGREEARRVDDDKDDDEDLNIDPALTQTPVTTIKKTATAKKTGSGKPPSRRVPNKAPTAVMEPIEDGDESAADGGAQDDDSEVDEAPYRKMKTPSKFKSPGRRAGRAPVAPHGGEDSSSSDDGDIAAGPGGAY